MNKLPVAAIFIVFQTFNVCVAGPQPSFDLEKLQLEKGMKRSVLERKIAKYSSLKPAYSALYPTESPNFASYTIGTIILYVTYKYGMAGPYVTKKDGITAHLKSIWAHAQDHLFSAPIIYMTISARQVSLCGVVYAPLHKFPIAADGHLVGNDMAS